MASVFRGLTIQSGIQTQIQDGTYLGVGDGIDRATSGTLTLGQASGGQATAISLALNTTVGSGKDFSMSGGAGASWSLAGDDASSATCAAALTITGGATSVWKTSGGNLTVQSDAGDLSLDALTSLKKVYVGASQGLLELGKAGATTNLLGNTVVASGQDFTVTGGAGAAVSLNAEVASQFVTTGAALTITAGATSVWSASAGSLTVQTGASATDMTVQSVAGDLYLDAVASSKKVVIAASQGIVEIGKSGAMTTIKGDLTVDGTENIIGLTTFEGDAVVGDGVGGPDTFAFDATTGRLGDASRPDVKWLEGYNHVFYVDDMSTSNTAGNNLTIRGGKGNGSGAGGGAYLRGAEGGATGAGGVAQVIGGAGGLTSGAGGAATISGGTPATLGAGGGVFVSGAAGVGTNQNGGAVSITGGAATGSGTGGAVTITGASASTWSTSDGALTLTSAAAATWSTGAGALTLQGAGGVNLNYGATTVLSVPSATAATVKNGVTLGFDTSGAINMPLGDRGMVDDEVFTGSGLDDGEIGGTYTGATGNTYIVEIDATGTPDTFKWSDNNGGSYTTGVSITGAAQTLSNGVTITFGSTTGHTLGDKWTSTVHGSTDARLRIGGTGLFPSVSAANLNTLTNGGDASSLHTHAGSTAATQVVIGGLTTTGLGNGDFAYISSANTVSKSDATTLAAAWSVGANEGTSGSITVAGVIESAKFTTAGGSPTNGAAVYLALAADDGSTGAGKLTATAPVSGVIRRVGFCVDNSNYAGAKTCAVLLSMGEPVVL